MEAAAHDAGVGLVVSGLGGHPASPEEVRRWVAPGRIDGAILAATSGVDLPGGMLTGWGIPVVALDPATRVHRPGRHRGRTLEAPALELDTQLIVRESTAPPAPRLNRFR